MGSLLINLVLAQENGIFFFVYLFKWLPMVTDYITTLLIEDIWHIKIKNYNYNSTRT